MPTTTNYGWTTPADTDLVKDGAAAIRTLGSSIDSTLKTQVDNTVASSIQKSLVTTTGDTIYATGASTPARLPIGSTGQVLTVAGGVPTWVTPASGVTTWTVRYGLTSTMYAGAYNGTNLYVIVGGSGTLLTSPDGITWTARTSGFGTTGIYTVAYGNGLWVAAGDTGLLSTSTDGITWTLRTSNMGTNQINHVIYANSTWIAVGRGGGTTNTGGIIYSTDGITWTRKAQSITVGDTYSAVSWNGTNFIVAASVSTNNYLYATTPSGTWTAGADGSNSALRQIVWDGSRNWVTTAGGATRYSTSATLGTTTVIQNVSTLTGTGEQDGKNKNYYYNGRFYISINTGTTADFSTSVFQTSYVPTGTRQLAPGAGSSVDTTYLFIGSIGQIIYNNNAILTSF